MAGDEGKLMQTTDWRILDINHQDNMVVLVSGTSPTVKRYGTPSAIDKAEIELGAKSRFKPTYAAQTTSLFGHIRLRAKRQFRSG